MAGRARSRRATRVCVSNDKQRQHKQHGCVSVCPHRHLRLTKKATVSEWHGTDRAAVRKVSERKADLRDELKGQAGAMS